MMTFLAEATTHILPHDLFQVGPVWVTNQMLMALVAAVLMLVVFPGLFMRPHPETPRGARNFFEAIMEFLRDEVFRPALKHNTDRFVPFLWTLFFFILFCNLLGLIPFGEIFGLLLGKEYSHYGGTATGNINTTGALAALTLLVIHFSGVAHVARDLMNGTYGHHGHQTDTSEHGHIRAQALSADVTQHASELLDPGAHQGHGQEPDDAHGAGINPVWAVLLCVPLYLWNFAPHPFKPEPGGSRLGWVADVPVWAMLLILELVGAIIKPFALMMRLFANMIAGHLVLAVLVGLITLASGVAAQIGVGIPVTLLSLLIRILELFVAFLQAYIFTFLATLFIASAVAPEH